MMARDEKVFLDSGAFTLYFQDAMKRGMGMEFYKTDEFWQYVDDYAEFLRIHASALTYYANVDVIGDPMGSYKVLKYLETKHGMRPVPVVHCGSSVEWVRHYIDEGYKYIALGGFVGKPSGVSREWCRKAFNIICDNKGMPRVRVHGFAMTSFKAMTLFPWYSVDSASWVKMGGFGVIMVPHLRKGKFVFRGEKPYTITVSGENPSAQKDELAEFGNVTRPGSGLHYDTLPSTQKEIIGKWLDEIGLTIDEVRTVRNARMAANLLYFQRMSEDLPDWPWAYRKKDFIDPKGFLQLQNKDIPKLSPAPKYKLPKPTTDKLVIYYSGQSAPGDVPEDILKDKAHVMFTYHKFKKTPKRREFGKDKRWRLYLESINFQPSK